MRVKYPKCAYGRYCLLKSVIKCCVHLSIEVSFLYFNYCVSASDGGTVSAEGTCSQVLRSTSVDP